MRKIAATEWQKRFWLEWRHDPQSTSYNIECSYKIVGKLQKKALTRALNDLVNYYYEGFRTYFVFEQEELLQVILDRVPIDIYRNVDVVPIPFDLQKAPLIRCGLMELGKNIYKLTFCFHHITIDASSSYFFENTFSALYNYYTTGGLKPVLPQKSIIDYLEHTTKNRDKKLEEQGLDFWSRLLPVNDLHVNLPLATGLSRTGKKGCSIYFDCSEEVTQCFKQYVSQANTSNFLLLSAIYAVFLARYNDQANIVLHHPINMRPQGLKDLTGCFVNNLPMLIKLESHFCLEDVIKQLIQQRKQTKPYKEISFMRLIQALRSTHSVLPDNPFNALLIETNLSLKPLLLNDLKVNCMPPQDHDLSFEFGLSYQIDNQIRFKLEYLNHFDDNLVQNWVENFTNFLHTCVTRPRENIFKLPLVSPNKLESWNKTQAYYPANKTIHQLFQEQAHKRPHAVAVIFNDEQLTYKDLDKRSNQLAHYIRRFYKNKYKNDFPANTLVASCVPRGIKMIVSFLAILKAGGCYVPLDHKLPIARLKYILQDTEAPILLARTNIIHHNVSDRLIINVDSPQITNQSTNDLNVLTPNETNPL